MTSPLARPQDMRIHHDRLYLLDVCLCEKFVVLEFLLFFAFVSPQNKHNLFPVKLFCQEKSYVSFVARISRYHG